VSRILGKKAPFLLVYLVLVGLMVFLFLRMPNPTSPRKTRGDVHSGAAAAGVDHGADQQVLDQCGNIFLIMKRQPSRASSR